MSEPARIQRGVYRCRRPIGGAAAYYAITGAGELLDGDVRRVMGDETEEHVVAELWARLAACDAPTHREPASAALPSLRLL